MLAPSIPRGLRLKNKLDLRQMIWCQTRIEPDVITLAAVTMLTKTTTSLECAVNGQINLNPRRFLERASCFEIVLRK